MKKPDLNLLVALHILIEERSVTAAAQRMSLSAPAMSRTLARIRDVFGDPILVRSHRGMIPTPKALQIQGQVRGIVDLSQSFFAQIQGFNLETLKRTFCIRANDLFIGAFAVALVETFKKSAPNSILRFISESDLDQDPLNAGSIDLVVSATQKFGAGIKVQNLFSSSYVGLARREHPIFDGEITAERFVAFDHLSVSRRGITSGPIDQALANLSLSRKVIYVTPTFHSALFALAESDLILPTMPMIMLDSLARVGLKLKPFTLPIPISDVTIVQAWHPRLDNDEAHQWLRRTIKNMTSNVVENKL